MILHEDDRPLYDALVEQGIAFGFRLEPQPPPDDHEHCKPADLAYWFSDAVLHPKPPKVPPKSKPPLTLADLPAACRTVLTAP